MSTLLIDNSNSRTKLCLATSKRLLPETIRRLPTPELDEKFLTKELRNLDFHSVIICSVIPHKADILCAALRQYPTHLVSHKSPLGFLIDYPQPDKIGADRLANTAATIQLYSTPAIVVDFGTAVTFDVINQHGAYCGGVIAPGLAAMTDYLAKSTALLPTIDPHEPESAIGKSTEAAMHAGAIYGYRGLVKEIIAQICQELPTTPKVIATGGDASLIAKNCPAIHLVDRHLTLEGLRIIGTQLQ